jgi:septal ring factor EnvC (AmiA/AmiB activator)
MDGLQHGGLYEIFLYDRETKIKQLEGILRRLLSNVDKQADKLVDSKIERFNQLQEEKKRLAYLYMKGSFSEQQLDEMGADLDAEIEAVQAEIREASKTNDEIHAEADEIVETIAKLKSLEVKTHYSKEELMDLLKGIVVKRDEMDNSIPSLTLQFKVFDLINRITDKYVEIKETIIEHDLLSIDVSKYYQTAQA